MKSSIRSWFVYFISKSRVALIMGLVVCQFPTEAQANYVAAQQLMARRDYVGAAAEYFQSYSSPKSAQEKISAKNRTENTLLQHPHNRA